MIPGLNHNVRYRDRVFHVQTEDSGLIRSILTTHVFLEGSVIAHQRSSYAGAVEPTLQEQQRNKAVKKLMQDQHRALLRRLVRGELDDTLIRMGIIDAAAISQPPRTRISRPPTSQPPSTPPSKRPDSMAQTFGPPEETDRRPVPYRPSGPTAREMPAVPDVPLRASEPPALRQSARGPLIPAVPRPSVPVPPSIAQNIDSFPSPALFPQQRGSSSPKPKPRTLPPVDPPTLRGSPAQQAALAYGRTLIDAPPVLPPEIAGSVKRSSLPPMPPGTSNPPLKRPPPSIQDAQTIIDPRLAPRSKKADLEHDTLLDLESPFAERIDAQERRTEPPTARPQVPGSDAATRRASAAGAPPPRPREPPPSPSTGMLIEDPTIEDALLGLSPIEEEGLEALDSERPRPSLDRDHGMRFMPPGQGTPSVGGPRPRPPGGRSNGLTSDPPPSPPTLARSRWFDEVPADRPSGPTTGNAQRPVERSGPTTGSAIRAPTTGSAQRPTERSGPTTGSAQRPVTGSAMRSVDPPRPATASTSNSGAHRPVERPAQSGRSGAPPPAWPPADADLEQFVRQQSSLIPEPDPAFTPTRDPPPNQSGQQIRVEERSLDDIILGYLSTKPQR